MKLSFSMFEMSSSIIEDFRNTVPSELIMSNEWIELNLNALIF
jgi:hypothetical protein